MCITMLSLILVVVISLFVGWLIGYGHAVSNIKKGFKGW